MGTARNYLRSKTIDFLTTKEDGLLGALYSFLSDEGVHPLKSRMEYARILRNFAIEEGLFLVEKLDKFKTEFKNVNENLEISGKKPSYEV
jgi:hypothetical protein